MSEEYTLEKIKVMQAYVDGHEIQWRPRKECGSEDWYDCDPAWQWDDCEYRIKPFKRKIYAVQYNNGEALTLYESRPCFGCIPHWHGWLVEE